MALPTLPPVAPTIDDLRAAIARCWARDTSDDPDEWTAENPTRGQCGVTALVVRELLGGEILMADVHGSHLPGERHAWNRLPSGEEVDLTLDQFRAGETLGPAAVDEPYVTDAGVDRGALLSARVRAALDAQP
jgi:hypothetical protein